MAGMIENADVVLIGAGIMSATVATTLRELEPNLSMVVFETLDDCALENSHGWNNAGTGHAANCKLNYTPQRADGTRDIDKALEVNVEFDISRQLWSHLVRKGAIKDPGAFMHACPHPLSARQSNVGASSCADFYADLIASSVRSHEI